jgi:hypothetical protein
MTTMAPIRVMMPTVHLRAAPQVHEPDRPQRRRQRPNPARALATAGGRPLTRAGATERAPGGASRRGVFASGHFGRRLMIAWASAITSSGSRPSCSASRRRR